MLRGESAHRRQEASSLASGGPDYALGREYLSQKPLSEMQKVRVRQRAALPADLKEVLSE